MGIINTGSSDIMLANIPDEARFCMLSEFHDFIKYSLYGIPNFIHLPEGYNYTILGRAKDIDENMAQSLMPLIDRGYGSSYYDYMSPDKNNSFYWATDALHSFKSFIESQGILLENPYEKPHPLQVLALGTTKYIALDSEWQEAQCKVKDPLVIKAENIT